MAEECGGRSCSAHDSQEGVRQQGEGMVLRSRYTLPEHIPSDLLPPTRAPLLQFHTSP